MNKDEIIEKYQELQANVDYIIKTSGILKTLDFSSKFDDDERVLDIDQILANA